MKLLLIINEIKQARSELDLFKHRFLHNIYQEKAYGFSFNNDDPWESQWRKSFIEKIKTAQSIDEIRSLMLHTLSDDQEDEDHIHRLINTTKQEINAK